MTRPALRVIECNCDRCLGISSRPDMRKVVTTAAAVALPVYGLLWAAWTMLP